MGGILVFNQMMIHELTGAVAQFNSSQKSGIQNNATSSNLRQLVLAHILHSFYYVLLSLATEMEQPF